MPQCFPVRCVERQNTSGRVSCKGQAGVGGQNACAGTAAAKLMRPTDLAGLIIDGFQYAFTPDAVVRPCPSESSVGWLGEVNPIARMCADHEEPGLRVKAGRPVVCHAALVRSDQSA